MKKIIKLFLISLLSFVFVLSMVACGDKKDNDEEEIEPEITWPLDGLMVYSKKADRRLATIDVQPTVKNWMNVDYFAILVYQPSPYAWAFQLAITTANGGQTALNPDAPQDSQDYTQNYTIDGVELWDLQVYFSSVFSIPAAIVNGGAHWIVVSRDVLGLDQSGVDATNVSFITLRFDISDYNSGIQMIIGKMMIFTEEINSDFSNGITVFNPASQYSDDEFWSIYQLNTWKDEAQNNFDEFMNKRRIKLGEEI